MLINGSIKAIYYLSLRFNNLRDLPILYEALVSIFMNSKLWMRIMYKSISTFEYAYIT